MRAVIDDHEIVWAKAYGVTTTGSGGFPVTPDTFFQAASISKPVVAPRVMHQVERAKFLLEVVGAQITLIVDATGQPTGLVRLHAGMDQQAPKIE